MDSAGSIQKFSFKQKVQKTFVPKFVEAFTEHRKFRKEVLSDESYSESQKQVIIKHSRKKMLKTVLVNEPLKAVGMEILYEGLGNSIGVGARDWGLSGTAKTQWGMDTSKFSLGVAQSVSNLIPQHKKATYAYLSIPAEWAISIMRIVVEKKIYDKTGVVIDPAATFLKPATAGTLEMANKILNTQYSGVSTHDEANDRLAIGILGIYGNIVRLAADGLIYLAVTRAQKKKQEKQSREAQ